MFNIVPFEKTKTTKQQNNKTTKQLKNLNTMKNLLFPCLLVISLMTATAAQLPTSIIYSINDTIIKKEIKTPTFEFTEVVEEADEAFDFDTAAYLPIGFDPYISFEEKYGIVYDVVIEEEDEVFEFNTKDYLPVGFGLDVSILNSIIEISIEEEDEAFDFNTKKYLPKGFKATKQEVVTTTEI